jgi:hypothetical protein
LGVKNFWLSGLDVLSQLFSGLTSFFIFNGLYVKDSRFGSKSNGDKKILATFALTKSWRAKVFGTQPIKPFDSFLF